jgi:hypothetical protein
VNASWGDGKRERKGSWLDENGDQDLSGIE